MGIHVPSPVPSNPAERDAGLRDVYLFTTAGKTRKIPHAHDTG
ncbi:MAG: hypothetical protein WBN34_03180 [Woeseia sp.]